MNYTKTIIKYVAIVGICFLPSVAISVTNITSDTKLSPVRSAVSEKESKIFLLFWDDQYLRTTKGTIYTSGIKIIDHANVDKSALQTTDKFPEVKFTLINNQVVQIDIYPSN